MFIFFVLPMWGAHKWWKILALDAGFHPVSLLHLHYKVWNILLSTKRDRDL